MFADQKMEADDYKVLKTDCAAKINELEARLLVVSKRKTILMDC
jgi:hypothetical protein